MSAILLPTKLMDVTPSMSKKNTKHNQSCLQDETCVRTNTESPKANYDTSMMTSLTESGKSPTFHIASFAIDFFKHGEL